MTYKDMTKQKAAWLRATHKRRLKLKGMTGMTINKGMTTKDMTKGMTRQGMTDMTVKGMTAPKAPETLRQDAIQSTQKVDKVSQQGVNENQTIEEVQPFPDPKVVTSLPFSKHAQAAGAGYND